jgi:flagellum-specific ATP synthase
MPDITTEAERKIAACGREILSTYRRAEDLISIGAYQGGSDADIDFAVGHINELLKFLKQRPNEKFSRSESLLQLAQIVS